ncbi:MAG: hypothetical protein M1381_05400 [Deltaproteobacteria bacterium]|nr:hypothetical protein [Deltaproteobacteria bacterium]MCL5792718.1 hypothetical protein [Deltaproteobacteria bacterium]
MNYKKLIYISVTTVTVFGLIITACSKKKKEEEITITLKTEGTAPSQTSIPSQLQPVPRPIESNKEPATNKAKAENPKKHVKPLHREIYVKTTSSTPAKKQPEEVTVNVPSSKLQPSPADVAKKEIIAIINRQKQAMAQKNVGLALEDLAGNRAQNASTLENYFNRYQKIDVSFSKISINVSGNTATAIMNQKTSIVTKSLIPETITELTEVQWTFVNDNNRWLITATQILKKIQ